MKKETKKSIIIYLVTIVISVLISFLGASYFSGQQPELSNEEYNNDEFHRAQITEIVSEAETSEENKYLGPKTIVFKAIISKGELQHREVTVTQIFSDQMFVELYPLESGDSIILYRIIEDSFTDWYLVSFARSNYLVLLFGLFLVLIILFGKLKGLNAVISLGFTIFSVFYILIPAIISNANIYLLTLGVTLYIIFMSFIIIGGLNRKTISASLGCMGGILVATLIAVLFMNIMNMSGILEDEFVFLVYLQDELPLDLRGILFVSIVIGSLGAVMDVAMSISSSLQELIEQVPDIKPKQIISSGLTIGKDIMGTMANTLILAYIGSSLPTILLLIIYAKPYNLLVNSEYIASEVLQAVAGSLGILFAIPLTSILSAILAKRNKSVKVVA